MKGTEKKTVKKWWVLPLIFLIWCAVYTALTLLKHQDPPDDTVSVNETRMEVNAPSSPVYISDNKGKSLPARW
ncbi:hypothetical protein [Aneurinibacillus tyrosinisolvens]|uniref:hypothetical protein n=1 Tax=Aneurinibacillus tyrosinisolvens TaxID=1443435 RepID=UPI00063F59D6|nr:hypothetical protein [Aneurinibacillus tyrosinisolvens]